MLQKYLVAIKDRTGRQEQVEATGNTAQIAVQAASLHAASPRSSGGLSMMVPLTVEGIGLR